MTNKWITNCKMKCLLDSLSEHSTKEKMVLNLQQLKMLFDPPFKQVKDCIIISEKSSEKLEDYFDDVIKTYMDRTGYEASNTETNINDFFDNKISILTGITLGLITIEIWSLKLKQLDANSKFCFIMFSDDEHVEIRFHKVRPNEYMWLSNDLEGYDGEAVGYIIL